MATGGVAWKLVPRDAADEQMEPQRPEFMPEYGDFLTVNDLAAATGISTATVRKLCAAGELPAVYLGARWLVPKTRLYDFVTGVKA